MRSVVSMLVLSLTLWVGCGPSSQSVVGDSSPTTTSITVSSPTVVDTPSQPTTVSTPEPPSTTPPVGPFCSPQTNGTTKCGTFW